jgi:hypothetical protein
MPSRVVRGMWLELPNGLFLITLSENWYFKRSLKPIWKSEFIISCTDDGSRHKTLWWYALNTRELILDCLLPEIDTYIISPEVTLWLWFLGLERSRLWILLESSSLPLCTYSWLHVDEDLGLWGCGQRWDLRELSVLPARKMTGSPTIFQNYPVWFLLNWAKWVLKRLFCKSVPPSYQFFNTCHVSVLPRSFPFFFSWCVVFLRQGLVI